MALTVNNPLLRQQRQHVSSSSIGGTPVACYVEVPFRGRISEVGCTTQGAITTADAAIAVAVNGTTNTALAFTIPVASAAAGQYVSATPTTAVYVDKGDVVRFTPSGASGSTIGGKFYFDIQMG